MKDALGNSTQDLADLFQWLSIPSVSADPKNKPDMTRAAEWLKARLEQSGLEAEIIPTAGHPVVYAQTKQLPERKTVLVYGHMDVQPADPLDEWETPPFEPSVRDGFIYARGSSDDKGQLLAHVIAAGRSANLPVNLKFLVEGEEETGSPNLHDFVRGHVGKLACDFVAISDGSAFAPEVASLTIGLRGLTYLEVRVTGPNKDLHSGGYGGAVANPINALVTMLASLKGEHGRVAVPGFYDRVQAVPEAELASWRKLEFSETAFAEAVGVDALPGEEGYSVLERLWARPTLDVNGIWGGYQGEGSKTVLPARAGAKVSMRLVPDQNDSEIFELVKAHLLSVAPVGVRVEVVELHGGLPVALNPADGPVRAAKAALGRAYPGREVALIRSGGSIPVVATFRSELNAPVLLLDLGLPDDGPHGPNERYSLECFHRGIEIAGYLYEEIAAL